MVMGTGGGTDTAAAGSVISLPKGGGAVSGLGEKFAPDLFTGTGNFSVPVAVPAGRAGLAPELALTYSTGHGNGTFGLGWALGLPGVTRKTSRGVPRYGAADVFVLSGAEDLVPVESTVPGRARYRPRTEGLFARIEHVLDGDFWEVRGKDGVVSRYGDAAVVADPADPGRVFGWLITSTRDALGNLVQYEYLRDQGAHPGHRWDQPLVARISYADYGDRARPSFLVAVDFEYEQRPDPFSDHRAGFEIRTSLRCHRIRVTTHAVDGVARAVRELRFGYEQAAFTGVSLLTRVDVTGVDDEAGATESLPPLTFEYTGFSPEERRFEPLTGGPAGSLGDPALALVDLRGVGLPDIVELGAAQRFWRNAGGGRFELPRSMAEAPPVSLGASGVRFMDADGDGRPDLVVSVGGGPAGYFPMTFTGWSRRSFQPYRQAPAVTSAVRLVDLDGDGLTDMLLPSTRLLGSFNDPDPRRAWQRTVPATGAPDVDLDDPRLRLADMTGDGLSDIVLLRNGNVAYWPNLGHNRWGSVVHMRHSPRLPDGFDPRRVLLGDVDGDGAADLVYVDHGRVLLWGNQSGDAWTEQPVAVHGTPGVVDTDAIELADLHGTGMAGVLFSRATDGSGRPHQWFLDFTGGVKPHLLAAVDNNLGAVTRVRYQPSTVEFLRDQAHPATRWRTTLPFPVHVVSHVEVIDAISGGRLTTEYRYHHGYWDGLEREFRGFAMVEQRDTETFDPAPEHFSPPTLTKTWFHVGPVASTEEVRDWTELDLRREYWDGDPSMLSRPPELAAFLAGLTRDARRSALRALRGQVLRTELYALDGVDRPYTVTETLSGVREESPPGADGTGRQRIFFPFELGRRTTRWERGAEPMTQFTFSAGHDQYGFVTRQTAIAVPRGRDPMATVPTAGQPYLATSTTAAFARRDDPDRYLVDRVSRTTTVEIVNDGRLSVPELRDAVLAGSASTRVIGHTRTYFDGDAFVGLPLGALGEHGLPVRVEALAVTDEFLDTLGSRPPYLAPDGAVTWPAEYPTEFRTSLPALAGYRHYATGAVPGYYVLTSRRRYDVHVPGREPRGLPVATLDPFGAQQAIEYDAHDLLPVRTVDAVGLTTAAVNDYRVLHPSELTDVNGNTTSVLFSPLGLVTAQFVRGKAGEGDRTAPGTTMTYDLRSFVDHGVPASVRTVRREHHDSEPDVDDGHRDDVLVSVEYSDGFGRVVQIRTQAEDVRFGDPVFGGGVLPPDRSAPVGDTTGRDAPDGVVVSGLQVYDNKGRVVRKYEPFFATGFDYAPPTDAQLGQQVTMFYDPRGQVVRTVNPDGSEQRVVLGVPADLADPDVFTPTPWETYIYDANDNAGRTHTDTAYRDHWNTPGSTEIDALGRTVVAVARNGPDRLVTRTAYDIQGNPVSVTDALGREAFRCAFDLAKRRWRMDSIDAGRRDTVPDAAGATVETRDSKGSLTLAAFDLLHRPSRTWARDNATSPVTLRQRVNYGDAGTPGQRAVEREGARNRNLLGVPVLHRDEAGLVSIDSVDFKGNVVQSTRRVIADAPVLATYETAENWQVAPFRVDWTPRPGQTQAQRDAELLDPAGYATATQYDALNRVKRTFLPTDVEGQHRIVYATYSRAGALTRVQVDTTVHVQHIAYDAKGQQTLIAYGNGVMTRHAYDPRTFRLTRLRTEPYTRTGATYRPSGPALQDYAYDYDLVGNILAVHDRAPESLDRRFTYDPVYRLLSATGREHQSPPPGDPWTDQPRGADITQTQPYTERYRHDPVGNILQLAHASASGFTREFTMQATSNRLHRMTIGTTSYDYTHDPNGNLTSETTTRHFTWNHADRLSSFATQTPGAEPSVHAHYLYDAAGQRVKKLVRRQGGAVEVTHYVNGVFEDHRWPGGANNHLHVMAGGQRVARLRIGDPHPDDRGPATAYHLADHLGSSTAVVDDTGTLTNREEYTPYGETSFGAYTRKRYRYTGRERDEESGLAYHSARYLSPYTARWQSCDPAGRLDSINVYQYCRGNPMVLTDISGTQSSAIDGATAFDTDRNGKLSAAEVHGAWDCTTRQNDIAAPLFAIPQSRFTDAGWTARNEILDEVAARNRRTEDNIRAQPQLFADSPYPMTGDQHRAYVIRQDVNETEDVRNGLAFGAIWYGLTGDVTGARMLNGFASASSQAVGDYSYYRSVGAGLGTPDRMIDSPARPVRPAPVAPGGGGSPRAVARASIDEVLFGLRDQATNLTRNVSASSQTPLTPQMFGSVNDAVFKALVKQAVSEGVLPATITTAPSSLNRPGSAGIDVWDTATGVGWDLMTARGREVLNHDARYVNKSAPDGTVIREVRPLVYSR
jgi:RHS repeat-associated protein